MICNSAVSRYGPGRCTSSSCVPDCVSRPSSSTRIKSARRSRLNRLDTTNVVRPVIASRNADTISFSVRASTDAVGSSRIRIGGCSNKRPRQRQPLPLAAGQIHARFAQHRFVTVRQRRDELVRRRNPRRAFDLFHRRVRMAERDVRRHGVREQKAFLIHNADLPPERVQVQIAQILSVRQNPARGADRKIAESDPAASFCPRRSCRRCR